MKEEQKKFKVCLSSLVGGGELSSLTLLLCGSGCTLSSLCTLSLASPMTFQRRENAAKTHGGCWLH